MQQASLNFNPPPRPGELFAYGTKLYEMYEQLYHGGLNTIEAAKIGGLTHSRRFSDIREKLKPYLLTVKKEKERNGIFKYKIAGLNN